MGVTYIQPNKHCFGQPPPTKHWSVSCLDTQFRFGVLDPTLRT